MTDYDAVLFDSDGVLVEPPARATQAAATRAAFETIGVDEPDASHVDEIVDGVTRERLFELCARYDLDPARFWQARERHDERSQVAAFRAGERERYEDVQALASIPGPRGVVSNNHHSTIAFVLNFFDLDAAFDTYYGREMTVESLTLKKPAPHYLERALADLDAATALYVGDSESDVLAAERAGIDSVFLRRPHCRERALTVTPTDEARTLEDVVALVRG